MGMTTETETETETESPVKQLILVTGLSGAGKSTALKYLEDIGFFWMDNIPFQLLTSFIDHCSEEPLFRRVAVGIHMRDHTCLAAFRAFSERVTQCAKHAEVLFLEADKDLLVRRYRETRRKHPLAIHCTVREAVEREMTLLEPIRAIADVIIDTSRTTIPAFKDRLDDFYQHQNRNTDGLSLFLRSFGFKYGTNTDADMMFDVRFLSNPHYDPALRHLTGLDEPVRRFLEQHPETDHFLIQIQSLFEYLIPRFHQEKKRYLTVDIGCTGGRHRSVYIVDQLTERLKNKMFFCRTRHRDIQKPSSERDG